MHQTTFIKEGTVNQRWFIIDAKGAILGRLAARVALILQGKNKPEYTPHIDNGDYVIIINADQIVVTGNKSDDKVYRYHTQFPGGLKETSYNRMLANHPKRIVEYAIRRMVPKTKMGRAMFKKCHVYAGVEHPHGAQQPEPLDLEVKRRTR